MDPIATASLLGYDASILRRLRPGDRDAIAWMAAAWLLSCALLSTPLVYMVWLVGHHAGVAVGTGVFSYGLLLALLRLLAAGGGSGVPHGPQQAARPAVTTRPAAGPTVMMGTLALLFAQPAQLPLLRDVFAPHVAQQRRALLERHLATRAALPELATGQPAEASYLRRLNECEFAAWQLQAVWDDPVRAIRYTLLFCGLILVPSMLARTSASSALRRYQQLHTREQAETIVRDAKQSQIALAAQLSRYATYRPDRGTGCSDPFELRAPEPLRKRPFGVAP